MRAEPAEEALPHVGVHLEIALHPTPLLVRGRVPVEKFGDSTGEFSFSSAVTE